jgi:hypothetical protein
MDTLLGVYVAVPAPSGTNPFSALVEVASNDDEVANSLHTSRVTFNAQAGVEYSIAVDGYNGTVGSIKLNWQGRTPVVRPANDDFEDACVIGNETGAVNGSNINGTKEPGESRYLTTGSGASVWYEWTAPQTASYTFRLTGNFNAQASIFEPLVATSSFPNFPSLNQMAEISVPSLSTTFNAVAGDQYFIVIDGTDGSTGTFNLAWEPARSTTGYSVSGFIKSSIGTPVANVPVQLVGATSKTSVTDVNGQYQFSGVAAGTYMVQPSSTSYTFGPPGWSIEVDDDDLTGIDFLAVAGITLVAG